tara:strand:- start:830 stop:2557 length:1728 start_codon:yes stop_codon:yes gene_type:complete
VASNYEVNIKLNTRTVNKQLNNLEKRISKLNKLAQGGKANKTVLRNEQEKIKKTGQRLGVENKILKRKQEQLKVDKQQLKVLQQSANVRTKQASGGGTTGGGGARGGGGSGALSSAIISGAFPLLFGQGPLVAGAGALGGGIGSLVGGQMGGFAGGLLATSIATPIQQFGVEAAKLGNALNPATKNVEALTAALGVTGTEFEKNIKLLQELGDEEAAFEQTRKKMLGLVGSGGVSSLEELGKDTTELSNSFTQLMTQMQAGFADMINSAGIFKMLAEGVKRTVTLNQANQNIFNDPRITKINEQRLRRAKIGAIRANKEGIPGFRELDQMAIDLQDQLNVEKAIADAKELQRKVAEASMKKTEEEIIFLEKHRDLTAEEFAIEVKIRELQDKGVEVDREKFTQNEKRLNQLQKERKLAEETAAAFERMSQSIATDISEGIKGMIRGTSTLNDMLNNVLNKLIDAAFNMAFFGNIQGTLGGGGLLGGLFRANGGPVKGGKSYIVGERGPEMFTPGVSGTITPNHQLGGSTSVVVNVDASGSAVEGDDDRGRELGRLISVAVQSELIQQKRPGGLLA